MSVLAMAAMFGGLTSERGYNAPVQPAPVSDEERARQKRNKGLKEFNINGKPVWALNRKNAERKARKA